VGCGDAGSTVTLPVLQDKLVRKLVVRTADRMEYLRPWRTS
jgi:hypothetical protein